MFYKEINLKMSSAVLSALEDFLKRYTTPGSEVRFFSRSHIFIAFRTFLASVKPNEIRKHQ